MNILIIPEDFLKDQFILKPIFVRLIQSFGKTRAKVRVCQEPRLRGVDQALDPQQVSEILERYRGMMDIFILCVDRDNNEHRRRKLDALESNYGGQWVLLAENAWEEIETWLLAGLELPADWIWKEVRAEKDVKERYFELLAEQRGLSETLGGGRKHLGEEAAHQVGLIREKCPDDFDSLARRLEAAVQGD